MKKPINNTPYAEAIKSNPEFQDQVFGQDKSVYKKTDGSLTNLGTFNCIIRIVVLDRRFFVFFINRNY